MKVTISGPQLEKQYLEFDHNISVEEVLNMYKDKMPYPIYLCKLNNIYRGIPHIIHHDSDIEFLDIRNNAAWTAYQDSLILLYSKAVHDVLGKDTSISIRYSFNKGVYTLLSKSSDDEQLNRIEARMRELVEEDLPIVKKHMTKAQAIALAQSQNMHETQDLLESIPSLQNVEIFSLDDEVEIFYGLLVPSTGYLKLFELRKYQDGILMRYPHPSDPNVIPEYEDQQILYSAFAETTRWGELLGINYVDDLNAMIHQGNMKDVYLLQEALHEKRISDLADEIVESKRRLVLICGPSSSGKTTFAKRLCIQLRVNGVKTLYMGTDDYFVESSQAPLDANGERDYESIRAVDTKLFVSNLQDLLDGKETDLPHYDFSIQSKVFGQRMTKIDSDEVIVIEGIHALNSILTEGIDENQKYKIYISPFTPISIDSHNRIPSTDCRLLRRMVRDHQFRNWSVQETIKAWPKVRNGEDNNIFPSVNEAHVFFNSNCIYEIAVLKKMAEPLLKEIDRSQPEYAEAQRLLSFFRFFEATEDEDRIVNHSIIREFIGGSTIV